LRSLQQKVPQKRQLILDQNTYPLLRDAVIGSASSSTKSEHQKTQTFLRKAIESRPAIRPKTNQATRFSTLKQTCFNFKSNNYLSTQGKL